MGDETTGGTQQYKRRQSLQEEFTTSNQALHVEFEPFLSLTVLLAGQHRTTLPVVHSNLSEVKVCERRPPPSTRHYT
jgi:hypothetical protein